jgi:hypothetical protein
MTLMGANHCDCVSPNEDLLAYLHPLDDIRSPIPAGLLHGKFLLAPAHLPNLPRTALNARALMVPLLVNGTMDWG